MSHRKFRILFGLICFGPILVTVGVAHAGLSRNDRPSRSSTVWLRYELLLNRCRAGSCLVVSGGEGRIRMKLDPETPSFAWDEEGATLRVGDYVYYLRFKASRRLKQDSINRGIDIGFGGRLETATENRQVTWADKLFLLSNRGWTSFPVMSVSGTSYQAGGYSVTPTLRVTVSSPIKHR